MEKLYVYTLVSSIFLIHMNENSELIVNSFFNKDSSYARAFLSILLWKKILAKV